MLYPQLVTTGATPFLLVGAVDDGWRGVDSLVEEITAAGGTAMAQLGAYDFAIRPAGSTSEVLNVVFCHVASVITWIDCRSNEPYFR